MARTVAALHPGTYRSDGHYAYGNTLSYGGFKLTDYLVMSLQACRGRLPSQELRRSLLDLEEPRPLLAIDRLEETQRALGFPVGYMIVYPEDLIPEGMFAGALRAVTPDNLIGPGIYRSNDVEISPKTAFIHDPLQDPVLREVYEALA